MAKRTRVLALLLLLLCLVGALTFTGQPLPKPGFNEAPGHPFDFPMEMPDWLMGALGANEKTGPNNSVLDFSLDYHILAGPKSS